MDDDEDLVPEPTKPSKSKTAASSSLPEGYEPLMSSSLVDGKEHLPMVNPKQLRQERAGKKVDLKDIPTHDPVTGKKLTALERLKLAQEQNSKEIQAPKVDLKKPHEIEGREKKKVVRTKSGSSTGSRSRSNSPKVLRNRVSAVPKEGFGHKKSPKKNLPAVTVEKPTQQETDMYKNITKANGGFERPADFINDDDNLTPTGRKKKERLHRDSQMRGTNRPEEWLSPKEKSMNSRPSMTVKKVMKQEDLAFDDSMVNMMQSASDDE